MLPHKMFGVRCNPDFFYQCKELSLGHLIGRRASKLGAPEGARSRHVVNQFVCVVGNVFLYIHFKTRGTGRFREGAPRAYKMCCNVCVGGAFWREYLFLAGWG